ncbi:hypothetical protein [Streptomyces nodosus]|uniref:hypothetical protein n=1 Tax=Streptomyces nodosus TaxID=40318 RepID=UPI00382D7978
MVHLLTAAMGPRKRLVTAGLLLGLCAAGCQASGGAGPAEPPSRPFGGVTYFNAQQRALLHTAEEQFVAQCMRSRGFDYRPQPLASGSHVLDANPYGLLTPTQAKTDGFGLTSSALNEATAGQADRNVKDASVPGWHTALLGSTSHRVYVPLPAHQEYYYNTDSCVSRAEIQLYGADYERLYNTFQVLTNEVVLEVRKDKRYLSAQDAWRECMRSAGSPEQALDSPPQTINSELAGIENNSAIPRRLIGRELGLAKTDADCQQKIGIGHTVSAVQADVERTVLQGRTNQLSALQRLRAGALAAAAFPASPDAGGSPSPTAPSRP